MRFLESTPWRRVSRSGRSRRSLLWCFRESLVNNRGISRQRNAIQVNDFSIHNQLNRVGHSAGASLAVSTSCRGSSFGGLIVLSGGRTMHDDTGLPVIAQKEIRTAHQYELCLFAFYLQDVRPG